MNELVMYEYLNVWVIEEWMQRKGKSEFEMIRNLRFSEWMIVVNEMNGYVRISECVDAGWIYV